MHQHQHSVAAELDVEFEHPIAELCAMAQGRQRVLRRQLACATVRNPAWIRPVIEINAHDATRLPVSASNQCRCSGRSFRVRLSPGLGAGRVASMRKVNDSPHNRP